ncbi:MAG: DUF4124 domain-containing protein [Burkholderiales bacterium]
MNGFKHGSLNAVLAGAALAGFFALPAHAAEVFKWVDKQGVTHYSSAPPAGAKSQRVRIEESVIPEDPAVVKGAAAATAAAAKTPGMPKYGPRNQSEASLLANDRAAYRQKRIDECQRNNGTDCARAVDTELAAEGALKRPVLKPGQNPANADAALQARRTKMIQECQRNNGTDCAAQVDTQLQAESLDGQGRVVKRAPAR